jgi:DNA-directed RNA polymerase subunit RPC12/RpoP
VVLDCPHCTAHIPLNAVVPGVHCPECKRALPIAAETWSKVLGQALDAAARASEGMPDVVTEAFAGGDINAVFERKPPVCALCDAPIDAEAALTEARTTQGWAHCARCQGWLAFRPSPIAIRPYVVAIACEQFAASAEPDPSKATQPLSFSCHQCGAVLPVDGTSRMVACQYCRASVVLPDALWKTVRPKGKASFWYLLCRG